ncbi:MAG TPA: FAD-dependent oxidoreductase, partial [Bacteroidales bacterium]|nr:FAD-dependent oxidoreductase [Bacteroidales bacterium]
SNQINFGELYPKTVPEKVHVSNQGVTPEIVKVGSFIAGGGIGGSALFRYLAEAGMKPVLANFGRGSSWRNIAGGRPGFSLPEMADIAVHNLEIFKELQNLKNIDYHQTRYVTFAHDETMYKALVDSLSWSDAVMVDPKDFNKVISPFINTNLNKYLAAQVSENCWQATPGRVIDLIRRIGINNGGTVLEDCKMISLRKDGNTFKILVRNHQQKFVEYHTEVFVNALGFEGEKFARMIGLETGLYPVKHQAFITRRLPMMGLNGNPLDMLIDRRRYKGFVAVYGQQLAETGQIIGCASPAVDPQQAHKNLKINSQEFLEIATEIFIDWIPQLSSVGFQAVWAGYYVEPRMIIDPEHGLFLGLRGQGFMLGQYLAKLYVNALTGKKVPEYFSRLNLNGDGLPEKAFK